MPPSILDEVFQNIKHNIALIDAKYILSIDDTVTLNISENLTEDQIIELGLE